MPGHFVWLPEEKGYTADLLQRNQTWREREPGTTRPTGLLQPHPATQQLDMGVGWREVRVGEASQKL